MPIAKRPIVELLLAQRGQRRAIRAEAELPELASVEVHGGLLEDLGLDPTCFASFGPASKTEGR